MNNSDISANVVFVIAALACGLIGAHEHPTDTATRATLA